MLSKCPLIYLDISKIKIIKMQIKEFTPCMNNYKFIKEISPPPKYLVVYSLTDVYNSILCWIINISCTIQQLLFYKLLYCCQHITLISCKKQLHDATICLIQQITTGMSLHVTTKMMTYHLQFITNTQYMLTRIQMVRGCKIYRGWYFCVY